jgi:putative ABC transport system ATP-binding protein
MALIDLDDVVKVYQLGQIVVPAVKGVTLSIAAAEYAAVSGPSGSGKTTLLNIIGVIDEPTSGSVRFAGTDLAKLSDDQKSELRSRSIGFVFQNFNLIPVLSALENVMLPLQIQGVSYRDARERAFRRLEQVGLSDFVAHRPDKLSGGQRQRVSIARALVADPLLIIADEPTGNLDSETAMRIVELLRELNRVEKTTIIFSTHDERLLAQVDRHIHLVDGRLNAATPPSSVPGKAFH